MGTPRTGSTELCMPPSPQKWHEPPGTHAKNCRLSPQCTLTLLFRLSSCHTAPGLAPTCLHGATPRIPTHPGRRNPFSTQSGGAQVLLTGTLLTTSVRVASSRHTDAWHPSAASSARPRPPPTGLPGTAAPRGQLLFVLGLHRAYQKSLNPNLQNIKSQEQVTLFILYLQHLDSAQYAADIYISQMTT